MKKLIFTCIFVAASLNAQAHHSFSAEFDNDKRISISGIVTEVRFRNPHVQYFVDVVENGQPARWIVAGQNMSVMSRGGVSSDTVSVGDEITVGGYAGRNDAKKIYLDTLVAATGTRYSMYGEPTSRRNVAAATEIERDGDSALLDDLVGDWAFDVDKPLPGAPFHLAFERIGNDLRAILDNEVVDIIVDTDTFVIFLDRENRAGFPAQMQLMGRLAGEQIAGSLELIEGYSNFAELDASRFTAVRTSADYWEQGEFAPMEPVDLTGTWKRKIVLGPTGRTNPQLTEAGRARHAEYKKGAYDPLLRCMEVGPLRRQARRGDLEILASTNRLTFIYEADNGIRRIWFDREKHSSDRPHDLMGESIGAWDGSTLVIDTRNLSEAVLTHNSEPISEDARIIERLWLNNDGDLVMEATLHDPRFYERPISKRLLWTRSDNKDLLYPPCDPDSFYRGLHFEGALNSYFENQPGDSESF